MLRVVNQACPPSLAVNPCPSQFPNPLGRHAFAMAVALCTVGSGKLEAAALVGLASLQDGREPRSLWNLDLYCGLNPADSDWTALTEATGISAEGRYLVGIGFHTGFVESFRADLGPCAQAPEASTGASNLALGMLIGWQWPWTRH